MDLPDLPFATCLYTVRKEKVYICILPYYSVHAAEQNN